MALVPRTLLWLLAACLLLLPYTNASEQAVSAPETALSAPALSSSSSEDKQSPLSAQKSLLNSTESAEDVYTVASDTGRDVRGVLVLGMHRSGTSLLTGLLSKTGLEVGPPEFLLPPNGGNQKGYFEHKDLMAQNAQLLRRQKMNYATRIEGYDSMVGLTDIIHSLHTPNDTFFSEGKLFLDFLKSVEDTEDKVWLVKEPRMSVTFKTWLPLLPSVPAIVFTFRHPLSVAESMNKREHFPLTRGVKLWMVYNKFIVENTRGLCIVMTSDEGLMTNKKAELDRVVTDLRDTCGVAVPQLISQADMDDFIDPSLQHPLERNDKRECVDKSVHEEKLLKFKTEEHKELYEEAIRLYCALVDGSVFDRGFEMPRI